MKDYSHISNDRLNLSPTVTVNGPLLDESKLSTYLFATSTQSMRNRVISTMRAQIEFRIM